MEQITFGLFTDVHYADRPMMNHRYYRMGLKKTADYLELFQKSKVDFYIHLGDLVDWPDNLEGSRKAAEEMMSLIRSYPIPFTTLLGNHDCDSLPREELQQLYQLPDKQSYYSFDCHDVHFIILDSNYSPEGTLYPYQAVKWDQCCIDPKQLQWLEQDLNHAKASFNILFVHALLDDLEDPHVILNAGEVRQILEKSGKPVVVFQGHMHTGYESIHHQIGYYTLKATTMGETDSCCWIARFRKGELTAEIYEHPGQQDPIQRRLYPLP